MVHAGPLPEDSLAQDYEKASREIYPLLRGAQTEFLVGQYACAFADMLGSPGEFCHLVTGSHGEREARIEQLLASFSHNLEHLVRKTWCDQESQRDKERVLSSAQAFLSAFRADKLHQARKAFIELARRLSALIFGEAAVQGNFVEWAYRIDPKLGLFTWFVERLEKESEGDAPELLKTELLVGCYFLASL